MTGSDGARIGRTKVFELLNKAVFEMAKVLLHEGELKRENAKKASQMEDPE